MNDYKGIELKSSRRLGQTVKRSMPTAVTPCMSFSSLTGLMLTSLTGAIRQSSL